MGTRGRKNAKARGPLQGVLLSALLVASLLFSGEGFLLSALALDQAPRCGLSEHIHDSECYGGFNRLTCSKTEHLHSENCYLVHLEDNDINYLLSEIDNSEEKTLEGLIDDVSGMETDYVVGTVRIYDRPLEVEDIDPNAVPRDTLGATDSGTSGATSASSYAAVSGGSSSGSSTYAIGDAVGSQNGRAYFFIYILNSEGTSGEWTSIGNVSTSVSGSSRNYSTRVQTSTMLSLINNAIAGTGTPNYSPTLTATSFDLMTSTSQSGSNGRKTDASTSQTTLGANSTSRNDAQKARYVRLVQNNSTGSALEFCRVEVNHLDGTSAVSYVLAGSTISLPAESDWVDDKGNVYAASTAEVSRSMVLTAQVNDGRMRVSYDLNFPDAGDASISVYPTLAGLTTTSVVDSYEEADCPFTARNSSNRDVLGLINRDTGMNRSFYFVGWAVNGDEDRIIAPGSSVTWEELCSLAPNGLLRLTGVWETHRNQTASFYIRYDAVAEDTEGNITVQGSQYYTKEVFCTHLFGLPEAHMEAHYNDNNQLYSIATVSAMNSVAADAQIRKLYETGVVFQEGTTNEARFYLLAFPNDADVIAQVKAQAGNNKVYADDGKGNPVQITDLSTLDADHYKVRWYVFKNQSSAWHIDGKLVKKEGAIKVTKSFAGNAQGIELAKRDFAISATNGKTTQNLRLQDATYDAEADTYTWLVTGVEHGEEWTISEPYAAEMTDGVHSYFSYADYRVVDAVNGASTSGNSSQLADGATSLRAVVSGQAYALDEDMDEILQVNFTNVYHVENSIVIKKEDSRTGSPLPGAVFQLWQGDAPMEFVYDDETGQYVYVPEGTEGSVSDLSGSETGYYEIMVGGFSYDNGNIVVKETQSPSGYTPVESIEIGYLDAAGGEIGIVVGEAAASYHNGLLVIPNGTRSMSVTAEKRWECPESEWEDVTVQLLANGHLASSLIPGVSASAQLTEQNGYVYTWDNLPTHANGAEITWSIREVAIGDEQCKADYSFANWIVGYEPGVYTEGTDGDDANIRFVVTNDTKRTMLRLTKTNMDGSKLLAGATFTLEHLVPGDGGYVADENFVAKNQTTSDSGVIVFDNLLFGFYRLVEVGAPRAYREMTDPIYLTIKEDGTVVVEPHAYAQAGSTAFSIVVKNAAEVPLPHTGGSGQMWLYALGGALCLLSLGIGSLLRMQRRGDAAKR